MTVAGRVFLTYWEEQLADGRRVMRRPGDPVSVSGDRLARLVALGAVSDDAPAKPKPAPDEKPEPKPDPAPVAVVSVERPLKTAKLEAWQDYARAVGVDAGKLSKAELIAKIGDR